MTLKVKIFEDVFQDSSTGHRITFRGQIWWKSAVAKLLKCRLDYHTKKRASARLVPAPFCQKWADRAQNSLNVVTFHPLTCPRIPNLVRICCGLPDLFRKDWFFSLKS